jgi:hypothetical protein
VHYSESIGDEHIGERGEFASESRAFGIDRTI